VLSSREYARTQEVQEGHKEAQNVLLQRIASLETSLSMANDSYAEAAQMRSKLKEKHLECADLQVCANSMFLVCVCMYVCMNVHTFNVCLCIVCDTYVIMLPHLHTQCLFAYINSATTLT
jgi:hypothetical protein